MALHEGKEGIVKIGTNNVVAEVREWSIDSSSEAVDGSSMNSLQANGGWRTFAPGTKMWEGDIKCWWDETDTNGQQTLDAGSVVTFKLYPEGDTTGDTFFSGSAIVTGVTRKASLDGNIEAEFTFKGTGALTEATV